MSATVSGWQLANTVEVPTLAMKSALSPMSQLKNRLWLLKGESRPAGRS